MKTMTTRRELANCIRALSMDAVERAKSGHPGAPMGMADIAQVLWGDYLKYNPAHPEWVDRDRFVLSNGHASMLLYSLLHLTGYALGLDEIKAFRQLGSRCAGHPEHEVGIGIETTTGPLGQGLAMAVGMALAEKMLAAQFNKPNFNIVNHYTYVFAGDGCMMEGVSHEACSLAGTMGLGKLIVFYDDNGISIDGKVAGWFRDDTAKRFEGYHWHVIPNVDGYNHDAIAAAIKTAQAQTTRPTLIVCKTIIGYGAPDKQGTKAAHGEALGADEIVKARKQLNWAYEPFVIPDELQAQWDHRQSGEAAEKIWKDLFARYQKEYPELAAEFERRTCGQLPQTWRDTSARAVESLGTQSKPQATRQSSQAVLDLLAPGLPEFLGGSADLTPSNNTQFKTAVTITPEDFKGNYLHYGVREFGMTAALNGVALHGGFIPYGGTFLTFSDYARNAVRLACLMNTHTILVYTHDSIGLGEDGPTHQPVEHLAALRAMPNMTLWRPCDGVETAVAWVSSIERKGPTLHILTRQALPQQQRTPQQRSDIARGGYILIEPAGAPQCIVVASGSEVGLAADAVKAANAEGLRVRLVSMPCTEVFDAQDGAYRESVLPKAVRARVAVEAGATVGWWKYVGLDGRVLGIDRFGASGKVQDLFPHFGFTVDNVLRLIRETVES
jgi:transketolase